MITARNESRNQKQEDHDWILIKPDETIKKIELYIDSEKNYHIWRIL